MGRGGAFRTHVCLVDLKFTCLLVYLSSESDLHCQVPGELELVPDRLHAMDGNNFMKQVDGSGNCDEHVFSSDYLIPPSIVDNFKDDVATHPGTQAQLPQALPFGDEKTWCTDNWTVANTVSKGTAQVFQQTGGFISACRHTIIETFIEMWQSGEL